MQKPFDLRRAFLVSGAVAVAVLVVGVAATAAMAGSHQYCGTSTPSYSCPPQGSSESQHLVQNGGYGGNFQFCIDEYLDPNNHGYYTGQSCTTSGEVFQYPGGTWGFPRVWGGSSSEFIQGFEWW